MKVLFCTDGIFPHTVGGMQRHSRLLIEELAKNEDIELVVVHPHKSEVFNDYPSIKEVPLRGIDENRNYLKECKAYSKRVLEVAKNNPDHVIYSQGLSIWDGIEQVAHRLIVNPHGLEPYQALSAKDKLIAIPFKKVFDKIFNQAEVVISLGGKLTEILRNRIKDASKIVTIPNAVNMPDGVNELQGNEVVNALFVGRFASNKGIHILMQAIEKLNEEGVLVQFNLAGKGPLFNDYVEKNTFGNVNFLGFVPDNELAQLYATNDVFVLPTLFEGMPTVVLEAMSFAKPIIVTDVGATSELVDASNGFLIEKNNVDALCQAIQNFSRLSIENREALGNQSRIKVEDKFTWEVVARTHIELFQKLAN